MFGPIFPGFIPGTIIGFLAKAVIDWASSDEGEEKPRRNTPVLIDCPIMLNTQPTVRSPNYDGNGWVIR